MPFQPRFRCRHRSSRPLLNMSLSSASSSLDPAACVAEPPEVLLPPLRQDLQLLPGLPHADGAPSWKIHDPVRNRFYEIGWMEFELLSRWQAGEDIDRLCRDTAEETQLAPSRAEAEALLAFLSTGRREPAKVVVWEHNSHLGDARATEMGQGGEWNVGQLVRQRYGADCVLVGFTTYDGTVTAASNWHGAAERKLVRPALPGSYEALFHQAGLGRFFLPLGGQNLIEPIAAGTPTLIGPHTFNFAEAAEAAIAAGAALRVQDADDVFAIAGRLLDDEDARARMRACGETFLAAHRGAVGRLWAWLEPRLAQADASRI